MVKINGSLKMMRVRCAKMLRAMEIVRMEDKFPCYRVPIFNECKK
jgi:hypothetical protein